jgi:hypothetical protein
MEDSGILRWGRWSPAKWGFMLGALSGALVTSVGYGAHVLAVKLDSGGGHLVPFALEAIWFCSVFLFSTIWGGLGLPWSHKYAEPGEIWRIYCLASVFNIIIGGSLTALIAFIFIGTKHPRKKT